MDSHSDSQPHPTDSSSDDQLEILASPVESENVPIRAEFAANSSVGQQPNSPMTQVEVDSLLERISMEFQRLNADLGRKVSESPEFQRLREELRGKEENLVEIQLKLTQCESDKSKFAQLYDHEKFKLEQFQQEVKREPMLLAKCKSELKNKSSEIVSLTKNCRSLEAQLQQQKNLNEELKRKGKEELTEAKSLQSKYFQLYNEESVKLMSVQQQFDCEKEKNLQKEQMLSELQNELIENSVEIDFISEKILKLRQAAQSFRTQLRLKSDELLAIKSQVKSALDEHLNCSICLQPMTEAAAIQCGHTFCKKCIDGWINTAMINKSNPTCPNCRSKCFRSAPLVAISQLQTKLLSSVNGEQPIVTRPNGENLPIRNNNNTSA